MFRGSVLFCLRQCHETAKFRKLGFVDVSPHNIKFYILLITPHNTKIRLAFAWRIFCFLLFTV